MSAAIPLTKMTNDVSDFTPYAARARSELQVEPLFGLAFMYISAGFYVFLNFTNYVVSFYVNLSKS